MLLLEVLEKYRMINEEWRSFYLIPFVGKFRILFYDGMVGFDICNDFREMEDLETCLYFLD